MYDMKKESIVRIVESLSNKALTEEKKQQIIECVEVKISYYNNKIFYIDLIIEEEKIEYIRQVRLSFSPYYDNQTNEITHGIMSVSVIYVDNETTLIGSSNALFGPDIIHVTSKHGNSPYDSDQCIELKINISPSESDLSLLVHEKDITTLDLKMFIVNNIVQNMDLILQYGTEITNIDANINIWDQIDEELKVLTPTDKTDEFLNKYIIHKKE
jgi:hypothetical protein